MNKVVIIGGTGFIGSQLAKALQRHYMVVIMTRTPERYKQSESVKYAKWNIENKSENPFDNALIVINLAGANIGKRWSKYHKNLIMQSRVKASEYVASNIRAAQNKPRLWIQASATGYYGNSPSIKDEYGAKGDVFLSDVCEAWEKPALCLDLPEVRVVIIRTGIVLSPSGGLWDKLKIPFLFGLGIIPGSGKQNLPWIALEDEIAAMLFFINNNTCNGIYNLVAPQTCTMQKLVKTIGKNYFFPIYLKMPSQAIKLLMGREMAENVILTDQYIVPKRLLMEGYNFVYKRIEDIGSTP